jgi:hypothetical protein
MHFLHRVAHAMIERRAERFLRSIQSKAIRGAAGACSHAWRYAQPGARMFARGLDRAGATAGLAFIRL